MVQRFAQDFGLQIGEASPEFRVLHSRHPGKAIAELSAEISAGLIVMATHARTGIRRLSVGSETAAAVAHAHCPVLAIAPDVD